MKSLTEYISESELNNKRTYGGYKLPNKYNGLWEDGASEGKYNVYTYEAIPPYLIKRYVKDINDL